MDNEQLSTALRDLPSRVLSVDVEERCNVFRTVESILSHPGVNSTIIKGICKVIGTTLTKYKDPSSQLIVRNFIISLIRYHHDLAVEHMLFVFKVLVNKELQSAPVQKSAKAALIALGWSSLLMKHANPESNVYQTELPRLLEYQSCLYKLTLSSCHCRIIEAGEKVLFDLWDSETIFNQSCTLLLENESCLDETLMLMLMVRFKNHKGITRFIEGTKQMLINHFVKSIINSKSKLQSVYVTACKPLLSTIEENEFELYIYPSMQKAMLRNPENILEVVGLTLKYIELEFSAYAEPMGKVLIQNLYSKDEIARLDSVKSLKYLSEKSSNWEVLLLLIKEIFGLLNGSNGKINVLEYRINLLQGAGNLSYNSVPKENLPMLLTTTVNLFGKALDSEIQEKVLCYTLDMFSLWTKKYVGVLPDIILNIFTKGLKLKTTTQSIRQTYLHWLLSSLQNSILTNKTDIVPILISLFDKANQNSSVISNLSEAISIACILLKIDEPSETYQHFWNIVFDINKHSFFTEKFITSASPDTLCHVSLMAERLLTKYAEKVKGSTEGLFRAVVHNLTFSSKKVRSYTLYLLPTIINSNDGIKNVEIILSELERKFESIKINYDMDSSNNDDIGTPSSAIVDILTELCSLNNLKLIDIHKLCLRIILISHHPAILHTERNFWENIVKQKFNLDVSQFISEKAAEINEICINKFQPTKSFENTVATLVRRCPETTLPTIVHLIQNHLNNTSLFEVSDDEYLIYLTPDGELYDKSVLPNKGNLYNTTGIKRENKVYSYKEQLEELQLRKEIDEKREKEGKSQFLKLTPKQQEIIKNQTEKEKRIRQKLSEMYEKFENKISLLKAACVGDFRNVSLHFSEILNELLKTLQSPLVAKIVSDFYYFLSTTCFGTQEKDLAHSVAVATIRLEEPKCELKTEWIQDDLNSMILKIILKLNSITLIDEKGVNDVLDVPTFTYMFSFLQRAVKCKLIWDNEGYVLMVINFIETQIKRQVDYQVDYNNIDELYNSKYLPRLAIFHLLMDINRTHVGPVRAQAISTLLEVATKTSNEDNCVKANKTEINLFLCSLQCNLVIVRDVSLRALHVLLRVLDIKSEFENDYLSCLAARIWIAKYDVAPENRILAENLWEYLNMCPPEFDQLIGDIIHQELCIQKASAASLIPLLTKESSLVKQILKKLISIYNDKLTMIPPKLDQFDREIEPATDQWIPRRGVAIAISQIANFLSIDDINYIMQFMVSFGLGDREEIVHKEMLAAALTIVDIHGKESIITLIPVFENFLDKAPKSQSYDNIRQAVVILMGSLARHLEKEDNRIGPIVKRLITALSTPSQQVQEAVADCLPHLMPSVKDEAPAMVKKLLHLLVKSEKYGERRGAAYGIAGIVKGLGILSLKQLDIMSKLTNYIQEKKNYKYREGALFAFEVLCTSLGRLFEPYIVHVLPHLLQCFGDSSQYVRQAADDTAKVVMGKLSAHGVKLVLPSLLDALDEDSWRTKTASVELLGAMAFCAPKQLSSCLPSIVPKLIEVLGDSHTKVQEAGADALKVIGSVIKNPEIQAIVPVLLKALEDPSNNTSLCLHSLLKTKFVHFIDAPSLALIMPVVQRAFMDRSTETRKMAAQIIGNMYSLTDQKDLTPYLPHIMPGLKSSLLDPVPEVRAVSARALGAMVKGMGEKSFEDLLPWLMQTLTSESSSVDRSGAAQGLSEVVGGLGVEKMHKLMPEIITTAERNDIAPHVKDGYIMMFIYMPGAFPKDFTSYIGQIINPILKALADENEYVRDTALKAGQRIVNMYAETAVTLLLPELERGLFDDNWRIRYSSVQLLGDLLYRISGVSGKMTTETASEDDNFGTEQSHTAIIRFLGDERRNRVLSGLYMGRSDVSLMVRQAALHVWKVVVTNTPRTLKEILPTLFGLLLGCLASTSYDKRQVAARTLGDLVRKLGERVLPEIIPILESGLNSEQSDQRQGVCIGLSEIMTSTSKEMVLSFVNSLVPTVRKALSDPLPEVREAAAKTFDSLHNTVGSKALDDILPSMLEGLSDPDPLVAENTLDGLRQVMFIKSRVVLPYLVPQLTSTPVNTKALSILVSVAGEALTKYLPKILSALLQALSEAQGTSNENQEMEYCQTVILSVVDEIGIRTIMDTLMFSAKSDSQNIRKSTSSLVCAFCMYSPADYSQYVPQLLRCLLRLMAETDKDILQRSWEALNAVIKALDSTQQIAHVSDVRQAVRFAVSDLKDAELPGFCLPKGITPLLPVFREAILNGLPEEKENAAQGLGEIIALTSPQSLQPSVVHITGPLIRILGDRFNAGVKAAVMETLAILLHKVGVMLKQFLPQLQTTFLKALHDPNRNVRMKAGSALAELVRIHSRADPLFNEIHNGIKNTDESAVRETMLHALRIIITPSGEKMSEQIKKQVLSTLLAMLGHAEDITRSAVGGCLGALLKYLNSEQLNELLCQHIISEDCEDYLIKHGQTVVLFVALKECPNVILNSRYEEKISNTILSHISSDKIMIACNGIRSATYLLEYNLSNEKNVPNNIIVAFTRAINHSSTDVKQLVAKASSHIARTLSPEQVTSEVMKYLVPMLVNGTKEKNGYVKSNSELALISILRLRIDDATYIKTCLILEPGAKESLSEVVSKVLRKVSVQPPSKDEELDDTLLT